MEDYLLISALLAFYLSNLFELIQSKLVKDQFWLVGSLLFQQVMDDSNNFLRDYHQGLLGFEPRRVKGSNLYS